MHLDPELAAALPALPDLHIHDLDGARGRMAELAARAAPADTTGVDIAEHEVPGVEGVAVRAFRPSGAPDPLPAVLLLHGGGFVMGGMDSLTAQAVNLCSRLPAVVVVVDYRLAPEHPYPAALRDCESALRWTASGADRLGVDPARLAVHGMSAGGGLAAALTLLVRDRGGPPVRFQVLDAPEVDDRVETRSARTFGDTPLWNHSDAVLSWQHYLRGWSGDVPAHAAPARADDLSGLPPAYLAVYENDPLRDEGLAYASALLRAGVSVELHLFPGTFHRSAVIAGAAVSQRQEAETLEALRRALHPAE
ncbi:alpha/beta hydrolase [Saccharopolyspora dendranthemae]|uniref:Acetyl esterase/lipase n=1 Tax=Saccharopolyspora dendranthemae TaxID=1181886 RepID=A0A561V809_9PSEU|nr:alpha/beta hydrolase [Saccharopolyspora dendranthemae]TWG07751.1 acetyl esterase/lipase [Saccharopolyspora dendranthemae]